MFTPRVKRVARFAPRRLVSPRTLPIMRAGIALWGRLGRPVRDVEVITLGSGASVRLFRPLGVAGPTPALLWIHGGSYVIGNAQQDDRLCSGFARRLGITVASVEHRLAPEHPYPAPLEDCYSALTWLAGFAVRGPIRVAIGGASAGGGLAAALALLARDRAEVSPAFQLLTYPMYDRSSAAAHIRTTGCGTTAAISSAGRRTSATPTRGSPCRGGAMT